MVMWSGVSWTEAAQIMAFLDTDAESLEKATGVSPKGYFDLLMADSAFDSAVTFLGLALPRHEAVVWAAQALRASGSQTSDSAGLRLFAGIDVWLHEPTEPHRRALWSVASEHEVNSPVKLLACAIFFSGGSIAPEDVAPVQPGPDICGKLAAAAILANAYLGEAPEEYLRATLDAGAHIATGGKG